MFPGSRLAPEPTRAECDAADEAYAQRRTAARGAACFALAEALAALTDRYETQWQPEDRAMVEQMFALLSEAHALAERLS